MADGCLFGRLRGPIVIDLFAGGGGASLGLRWATGVEPVAAINHCLHAIQMHALNHPTTEHYHASVFDVAPLAASRGRAVDLLWASPDCTDHSRAKGGKPRESGRRALAWVVVDWAREVRPRIICVENVPEFEEWGPLDEHDRPIKSRRGELFREWVGALEAEGYAVEWRLLRAADYGVPTTRRRLFLVARCDGRPIVWPEPTHTRERWPWAAECIDWNIPTRSIFGRSRPLAEATQRRIAEGVRRYVLGEQEPFLLCLSHGGRLEPVSRPLSTITATPVGGDRAVVVPMVEKMYGSARAGRPVTEPLATVTGAGGRGGGHLALAAATLVETRNGEREGQAPRCRDIRRPLGTVTAGGSQGALVSAFLAKHYGGVVGHGLRRPVGTVTAVDHHSLVTVEASGPIDRAGDCAAFLMKYFGTGGQWSDLRAPMPTVTAREGLAVVTVDLGGAEYVLTDIGMRMLTPRELARAQGFPDDYQLIGSKGQQIERIGNSVVPQLARAVAEAQLGERA